MSYALSPSLSYFTTISMTILRSIHVSANDPIPPPLFMAEYYSVVHMCHILSIHSFVNGHLGCFHVPAIVNSAAVNMRLHISFWAMFFSQCMLRSGRAGSHGDSV